MSSGSPATTNHNGPRYPGYPYVNPPSFGVPTIDSYTATRWANLPRRPIGAVRLQDQAGSSGSQSNQVERDQDSVAAENKQDLEDNPVVYVDIPDTTENSICEVRNHTTQPNAKTPEETISYRSDDEPVLYIDLPEDGESHLFERRVDNSIEASRLNQVKTNEEDEEPVVYIDIPECSGSGVSERRPEVEDGPSTNVVQETIFYDQFKDRRIDVMDPRDSDDSSSSSNSTMRRHGNPNAGKPFGTATFTRPGEVSTRRRFDDEAMYDERIHGRPQPPTSLSLWSPGTNTVNADSSSSRARPSPGYLPSYLTAQEYQDYLTPDEEFRLPPLAVTEFPEPPPAYTEIDLTSPQANIGSPAPAMGSPVSHGETVPSLGSPVSVSAITVQPQRTRVILNDENRKFLTCQHCGMTVQTIVVREANLGTHFAAVCFLLCGMFPCAILVYWSDMCKGKVHYCPNCNKKNT